ncbi:MAG TPA: hypothetical protein VIF83_03160 [Gemmatimonadaceae bacterium]
MSVPFVTSLRTAGDPIKVGDSDNPLHIRVQVADLWDSVRVDAGGDQPVTAVKRAALAEFYPDGGVDPDELVVRLHGFEILDEAKSLLDCSVRDGSILLLVSRRRRPVR